MIVATKKQAVTQHNRRSNQHLSDTIFVNFLNTAVSDLRTKDRPIFSGTIQFITNQ